MTNSTQQRRNMVESQVRPSDVTDRRILRAMLEVPRELFVPKPLAALAYMDGPVPVVERPRGSDAGRDPAPVRSLLPPRTFAKLVQLAEIGAESVVLDVGCATGYSTAVLARLARSVVAVEDAALAAHATGLLRQLGVGNALVIGGPLPVGAPAHAPFDAILLEGAVPEVPQSLLDQLKDGGRLVGVIAAGGAPFGQAQVWRRTGKGCDARPAFDAGAEPLPGFARAAEFAL
jgi:protein-L-isoaspartate(D-aspartate) O-methyltransferase